MKTFIISNPLFLMLACTINWIEINLARILQNQLPLCYTTEDGATFTCFQKCIYLQTTWPARLIEPKKPSNGRTELYIFFFFYIYVLFCIYFVKCDAITSISSHLDWTSLAVSEGWCQAGKVTPSCPQLGNRICSNGAAAAIQPGFKTPSFVGINKECRMVWHGLFLINMFFVWQVMTTDFLRVAQFLNSE